MNSASPNQPNTLKDVFHRLELLSQRYPPESESVRVDSKLIGRVLAEDIVAERNIPEVRTSREHGFATMVDYSGEKRRIVGSSTALSPYNAALLPGECVRIAIGGVVPEGADTVVPADDVALTSQEEDADETVEFVFELGKGENIREPGSDAKTGDVLLTDGFRMDSVAVGILREVNVSQVEVYRKPSVCVMSIGNRYEDKKQMEFSRPVLQSLFHSQGFTAIDAGNAEEELHDIEKKFRRAAKFSCVIVTTGATGTVREVTKKLGLIMDINTVPSNPGNFSFAHGKIDRKPVLLCMFPADVSSSWIGANLFVSPMLRAMEGRSLKNAPKFRANLTESVRKSSKVQFLCGRVEHLNGSLVVKPIHCKTLMGANSIIEVSANSEGGIVEVHLIESPNFQI